MPDTASTTAPAASRSLARPGAGPLAAHWMLDPDLVYLNHGSFGACPRAVLDAQSRYRAQMERVIPHNQDQAEAFGLYAFS